MATTSHGVKTYATHKTSHLHLSVQYVSRYSRHWAGFDIEHAAQTRDRPVFEIGYAAVNVVVVYMNKQSKYDSDMKSKS